MQIGKWPYKNIPVKPEIYQELEGIRSEVEKDTGLKFNWSAFMLGILVGSGATVVGVAVAKALKKYQKKKKEV